MPDFCMISFSMSDMSESANEDELLRLLVKVSMKEFKAISWSLLWLELRDDWDESSRSA